METRGSGELPTPRDRWPLDLLMRRLGDPALAGRFRRVLSFRQTSRHVNPLMLAVCGPGALYVQQWREHAMHCRSCRVLYSYFGLL
jgi:hypothetical protein